MEDGVALEDEVVLDRAALNTGLGWVACLGGDTSDTDQTWKSFNVIKKQFCHHHSQCDCTVRQGSPTSLFVEEGRAVPYFQAPEPLDSRGKNWRMLTCST